MTTRIYKDANGWTAFLRAPGKGPQVWDIISLDGEAYAVYDPKDGMVRPVRGDTTGRTLGRAPGRVEEISEAVIIARAAYRLTHLR
jgi:hypothetical protein